jgi:23S rRNA pseudouridine1911/1915/1917 synthase
MSSPEPRKHYDTQWDDDAPFDAGGKVDRDALYRLYVQNDDDETPITVRFVLTRDLNKRLDRYLVDRIPFLSRTSLQRLIREEAVQVNGRIPKASTKLRLNDEVIAVLPPPPSNEIPAEEIPLEILHEDDDLIVINKHDDIIVHPARGNLSGTIINGLSWHFKHQSSGSLSSVGEDHARPGVVHRLDRHTTGVMVVAKSDTAHWRLGKQFEHRRVNKRYLALVHGEMEPLTDVIDLPLGKHPTVTHKYAVRWDDTGKPSVTIYRVRERYEGFTLVELELKSGRTHQIRVHLSHLGYPIVGDDVYGGKRFTVEDVFGAQGIGDLPRQHVLAPRQFLHASLLGFEHPISHAPVTFQAPLREDMAALIRLLREHRFVAAPHLAGVEVDLDAMM